MLTELKTNLTDVKEAGRRSEIEKRAIKQARNVKNSIILMIRGKRLKILPRRVRRGGGNCMTFEFPPRAFSASALILNIIVIEREPLYLYNFFGNRVTCHFFYMIVAIII